MRELVNCPSTKTESISIPLHIYKKNKINDDEISLNGKMYDIKSVFIKGDHVEILALHDKEEENLLIEIADFFKNRSNPNSTLPDKVFKILTLSYLAPGTNSIIFSYEIRELIFHPYITNFSSYSNDVISPPPQLV